MNKMLIVSILVVGSVLILGFVGRLSSKESQEERAERGIGWVSSELNLSDQQRSKLVSLVDELRSFKKEMKEDRQEIKDDFIGMMASDELDQSKVLDLVKEKQKIIDEFAPRIVAELADFHKSLNPEQRKKIADKIQKHSHRNGLERWFHHRDH